VNLRPMEGKPSAGSRKPPGLRGSVDDQERGRANFGTYLVQLPDLRGSQLLAAVGLAGRPCILAGHRRLAGGGRQGSGSAQAAHGAGTAPVRQPDLVP
jgi:hypothetical protein